MGYRAFSKRLNQRAVLWWFVQVGGTFGVLALVALALAVAGAIRGDAGAAFASFGVGSLLLIGAIVCFGAFRRFRQELARERKAVTPVWTGIEWVSSDGQWVFDGQTWVTRAGQK